MPAIHASLFEFNLDNLVLVSDRISQQQTLKKNTSWKLHYQNLSMCVVCSDTQYTLCTCTVWIGNIFWQWFEVWFCVCILGQAPASVGIIFFCSHFHLGQQQNKSMHAATLMPRAKDMCCFSKAQSSVDLFYVRAVWHGTEKASVWFPWPQPTRREMMRKTHSTGCSQTGSDTKSWIRSVYFGVSLHSWQFTYCVISPKLNCTYSTGPSTFGALGKLYHLHPTRPGSTNRGADPLGAAPQLQPRHKTWHGWRPLLVVREG